MNKPNYNILTPFKRWTIQNFPFIEEDFDAITNYQLLCKIVDYLNKVIENEKLLEQSNNELIDAFNKLKAYVDDYFDNLDLQGAVDTKLDEMAESGELTDIIAQYLDLAGVLAYDTISDMSDAENLTNGSTCYCLGKDTYNDGKGGFYKVRTVTVDDNIDGFNIVALDVSNTLIAERMLNYYINDLYDKYASVTNINQIVFLGDSFGALTNNWVNTFVQLNNLTLGTDCYNFCTGGSAFIDNDTPANTYLTNLQDNESSIPDKTKIKSFIICGGWNDRTQNTANLKTAVSSLVSYIKSNYPNATIYVGMIGNTGVIDDTVGNISSIRNWLITQVLDGYRSIIEYGGKYLDGVENVMHDYSLYSTFDYVHPNADGCIALGKAISIAYHQGSYHYSPSGNYIGFNLNTTNGYTFEDGINSNSNINFTGKVTNGMFNLKISGNINFSTYYLMASNQSPEIPIASYTVTQRYFRRCNYIGDEIPVLVKYKTYETTPQNKVTRGLIRWKNDGKVYIRIYNIYEDNKYLQNINILVSEYTFPFICQ